MSVSLRDVAPRKYWTIMFLLTLASMVAVSISSTNSGVVPKSWITLIVSWADTAKYIGIVLVLATSVTWKWRKNPNPIPITPKLSPNIDETPDEHINRKKGFAIGVFLTIYGASVEFISELVFSIIPQFR